MIEPKASDILPTLIAIHDCPFKYYLELREVLKDQGGPRSVFENAGC